MSYSGTNRKVCGILGICNALLCNRGGSPFRKYCTIHNIQQEVILIYSSNKI